MVIKINLRKYMTDYNCWHSRTLTYIELHFIFIF